MNPNDLLNEFTRLGPELVIKFFVAVLCGGMLGMERETTGKPAGLRTSILVCAGSMLFTELSILMGKTFNGDGTRIAAQIVTGVGFLGAGVILHGKRGGVFGVTTSAMIWLLAALGMMIGAGYPVSATIMSVISVVMLLVLRRVEGHIQRARAQEYSFVLTDAGDSREHFMGLMELYDESIQNVTLEASPAGEIVARVTFIGINSERRQLLHEIYKIKGLRGAKSLPPSVWAGKRD